MSVEELYDFVIVWLLLFLVCYVVSRLNMIYNQFRNKMNYDRIMAFKLKITGNMSNLVLLVITAIEDN